jgi:hypothetical protein
MYDRQHYGLYNSSYMLNAPQAPLTVGISFHAYLGLIQPPSRSIVGVKGKEKVPQDDIYNL